MGGGSAENFFVSENTTVGSVIGVLRIAGDPGPQGDIQLQLKTTSQGPSAIAIAENSKNVILVAQLDKEVRKLWTNWTFLDLITRVIY